MNKVEVEDFKPVVLYVYKNFIDAEKTNIIYALRNTKELQPRFEELGLLFNTEMLQDFLTGGKKIMASALSGIEIELKKVEPMLRKGAENNYRSVLIEPLDNLIKDFNRAVYIEIPSWVKVENWEFFLTEQGKKELELKHTIIAKTQEQLDIWNELNELCEKIKALENKVSHFGLHLFKDPALVSPNLDPVPAGIPECRKNGFFVRK